MRECWETTFQYLSALVIRPKQFLVVSSLKIRGTWVQKQKYTEPTVRCLIRSLFCLEPAMYLNYVQSDTTRTRTHTLLISNAELESRCSIRQPWNATKNNSNKFTQKERSVLQLFLDIVSDSFHLRRTPVKSRFSSLLGRASWRRLHPFPSSP